MLLFAVDHENKMELLAVINDWVGLCSIAVLGNGAELNTFKLFEKVPVHPKAEVTERVTLKEPTAG